VLGLHPFAAQKALQAASRLKPSQIADMYECILWADEAQKSGHDASLALSSMVLELVRFFSRKQ
jgi:hypothetical protein